MVLKQGCDEVWFKLLINHSGCQWKVDFRKARGEAERMLGGCDIGKWAVLGPWMRVVELEMEKQRMWVRDLAGVSLAAGMCPCRQKEGIPGNTLRALLTLRSWADQRRQLRRLTENDNWSVFHQKIREDSVWKRRGWNTNQGAGC